MARARRLYWPSGIAAKAVLFLVSIRSPASPSLTPYSMGKEPPQQIVSQWHQHDPIGLANCTGAWLNCCLTKIRTVDEGFLKQCL